MYHLTIAQIEQIVIDISREKMSNPIEQEPWYNKKEQELWNELVACLIGSRVSFEHANSAYHYLLESGILEIRFLLQKPEIVIENIQNELQKPMFLPEKKNGEMRKFRYPNKTAKFICQTAQNIYLGNYSLKKILIESNEETHAREKLIQLAHGIGPKQASMFLRNVSFSSKLAIIDSHILRYLENLELINKDNNGISNYKKYVKIESVFIEYAKSKGISLNELDVIIWSVMRSIKVRNS